jgi:spermidine synthase
MLRAQPAHNAFPLPAILAFVTVFLSAWLLFLIEPIAVKQALPILGGSPLVWNVAMVFFQFCLLAGYLAAHLILQLRSGMMQLALYAVLLVLCFGFLPFTMASPSTDPVQHPFLWILTSLTLSLSLPFVLLSMTNTLMQGWIAHNRDKISFELHTLYAASNAGSLLALASFFPLEYAFALPVLRALWTWAFLAFVVLIGITAWICLRRYVRTPLVYESASAPSMKQRFLWVSLAFIPSALFLSVTTYIATDIASVPLLWVLPLAIYLVTFILAFSTAQKGVDLAARGLPALLIFSALAMAFNYHDFPTGPLVVHLLCLLAAGLVCHGTLARRRPAPRYLSEFYLWLSVGGVLGGIFSSLLAPQLFNDAVEYPLLLVLVCLARPVAGHWQWKDIKYSILLAAGGLLLFLALQKGIETHREWIVLADRWIEDYLPGLARKEINHHSGVFLLAVVWLTSLAGAFYPRKAAFAICMAALLFSGRLLNDDPATLYLKRNFFGVSRVYFDAKRDANIFKHGTTVHSIQSRKEEYRLVLASYYGTLRPVYNLLSDSPRSKTTAVVGLGAGTLLCLAGNSGDFDLFEIDPNVVELAEDRRLFTYMRDCGATKRVILGDGRINIAAVADKRYGFIVLDAFSSDAIPTHLLTKEALQIYLAKLAPDGMLAFNISNRFFNLAPLLGSLANSLSLEAYIRFNGHPANAYEFPSTWVVMTRAFTSGQRARLHEIGWDNLPVGPASVWTDQYSNILSYLK